MGAWTVDIDAQDRPVRDRRYLTAQDRQLIEEFLAAVTSTSVPLTPQQTTLVDHARGAVEGVDAGDVEQLPHPTTSTTGTTSTTTTSTTTTTTTVPPSTTTTDRHVRGFVPFPDPPTSIVPPPFTVTVP